MDVVSTVAPALAMIAVAVFVSLLLRLVHSRRSLLRYEVELLALRNEAGLLHTEKAALHQEMSLARIDLEQLRAELSAAGSTMAAREEELDDTRMLAREAGATKSLFVANMSHELRTPLNGILGLTRNLLDSPLTPQQRSEVELIQVAGEDLVRIVNNVLDLSKLEAGKLTLEKVPFDLCELLEGAFCLLYPQAERKRLAYGISYSNRIHRKFVGDPFRLRQVALNLLSNAIKFTQSGMVMLHATDGELRGGAQWIRLQVEDTGIGIDSGKLRLIFDEFQQADLSTTRKYGGTGLGLSLSKRIVGLMGGEIDVESEPGQGSMFIVQIPLIPIRSADGFEGWHDEVLSLEGLNLLIQDRHSNQMSVMLRLLEALPGLSVERFSTAEEASTRILGSQGTQDAIDAVVSVEGSSAFSPAEAQRILRQIVSQPPLHIVLSENAGGPATTQSEGGTSVVLHAPLLPSRLIALLYQVRRIPVGPLFESAGLTAFDVYRDPQEKYREQLPTLVAHENPVELRLLEVMLQKLGRSFVSARTEADLLALLQSGAWHAFLIQGRMLQQSAANVLLPEKSPPAVPLRLALVGDAEDAVIHRVSESCVAFAHFYAMPRLSQLRDFFRV